MDLGDQFSLEHLLFKERTCRSCSKTKDLINDFYLIRKDRGAQPSAYSYECKTCTVKRIIESRKLKSRSHNWQYPDW